MKFVEEEKMFAACELARVSSVEVATMNNTPIAPARE
jgi:hypothetical protein